MAIDAIRKHKRGMVGPCDRSVESSFYSILRWKELKRDISLKKDIAY